MANKIALMSRTELNDFIYEVKQFCEDRIWGLKLRLLDLTSKADEIKAKNLNSKLYDAEILELISSFYLLTIRLDAKDKRTKKMSFSSLVFSNIEVAQTYFEWSIEFYSETATFCDDFLELSQSTDLSIIKDKLSIVAYSLHAHFNAFRDLINKYIESYRNIAMAIKKEAKGVFEQVVNPKDPKRIETYISWAMPDLEYFHAKSMFEFFESEGVLPDELKVALEHNILRHEQATYLSGTFDVNVKDIDHRIDALSNLCDSKLKELRKEFKDANQSEDFKNIFRESYAELLSDYIAGKKMMEMQEDFFDNCARDEVEFVRGPVLFATDYAAVLIHFITLEAKIEDVIKRIRKLLRKYKHVAGVAESAVIADATIVATKSDLLEEDDADETRATESNTILLEQKIRELNLEASKNKALRKQNESQAADKPHALTFSGQAPGHDSLGAIQTTDDAKALIYLTEKNFELLEELLNPSTQIAYRYTPKELTGLAKELGAEVENRNNKFIIKFPDFKQPVFINAEASDGGDRVLFTFQNGATLSFHNSHRPGHNNGKLIGGAVQTFIKVLKEAGITLELCAVMLKSDNSNRLKIG